MKQEPLLELLKKNEISLRAALYAAHAIKNDISVAEAYVLCILFEQPRTKNDLLWRINRDRTSQLRIVREMKQKGLIEEAETDNLLRLSGRGFALYKKIVRIATHYIFGARTEPMSKNAHRSEV